MSSTSDESQGEANKTTDDNRAPGKNPQQAIQASPAPEQWSADTCIEVIDYLVSLHHETENTCGPPRPRRPIQTEVNLVRRFKGQQSSSQQQSHMSNRRQRKLRRLQEEWYTDKYIWQWAAPYLTTQGSKETQDILRVMLNDAVMELKKTEENSERVNKAIKKARRWLGSVDEVYDARKSARAFVKEVCSSSEKGQDR